jgi:hypothetical protein
VAASTEDHVTETISPPRTQADQPPHIIPRPETDNAALRAIEWAEDHVHERALQIRANPEAHKLVEGQPGADQPAAG